MEKDLKNKTFQELEELITEMGQKKYLAKYIFSFIHAKDACCLDDITPLSKDFRRKLTDDGYFISNIKLLEKFIDPDGTIKFLFELHDGCRVESVLMTSKERKTLCISCQAGCRMGCVFCATAKLKLAKNLSAGEIVDQLNKAVMEVGTINNVVYMGMGEPMDNYDNVMRSLHIINHHAGKCIGQRHLTISTCGIPEGIEKFADEKLQVHLSVSLHAATDEKRMKIMGVGKKYPLKVLLEVLGDYQIKNNRRIMFSYCMIKGLNDSPDDARAVIKLIKGFNANVNLIEYNSHPGCEFESSSRNTIHQFMDMLMKAGVETTVRYKRGDNIKAACGQLGATSLKQSHE